MRAARGISVALFLLLVGVALWTATVKRIGASEARLEAARNALAAATKANALLRANLAQARVQAAAAVTRAIASEAASVRHRATADSLSRVRAARRDAGPVSTTPLVAPVSGDSVGWYRGMLTLAEDEIVARRAESDSLRSALVAQQQATQTLLDAVAYAEGEAARTRAINTQIAAALAEATAACRVAGFVPCPSRTMSTVIGAVGGAGLTFVVLR